LVGRRTGLASGCPREVEAMERDELVRLASEMVAIPSVNPLEGPVGEGRGEAELAAYVESRLKEAGIECEQREAAPGRPSVVARLAGEKEEAIWFDAHLDTVSGEGMEFEPFVPRREGEKLYGRGAADDKASLAAMMGALMSVARSGKKPPLTVMLTGTADEEYRMRGLRGLLESGLRAEGAIVGEPTGLEIVVAHKGVARFKVVTKGKAAHSSRPEAGVNAIYRMMHVVRALEAYARGGAGRLTHPMLGKPTLSVGVIRGGEYVNVVPDRCEIEVDRRLLPGEQGRKAVGDIRTYLMNAIEEDVGLEVIGPELTVPGLDVSGEHPVVQAASAAVREVTGRAPLSGMTGTTHAGPLMEAGVPAVVVGPGAMGQAHTATEELDLNQLEQAAGIYEALMRSGIE
jgi:acetylornithine deacetylase/succinyl-diaminopimelate desuccinylase family protein